MKMASKLFDHPDVGRRVRSKAIGICPEFDGVIMEVWIQHKVHYLIKDKDGKGWHRNRSDILLWY